MRVLKIDFGETGFSINPSTVKELRDSEKMEDYTKNFSHDYCYQNFDIQKNYRFEFFENTQIFIGVKGNNFEFDLDHYDQRITIKNAVLYGATSCDTLILGQ